MTTEMKTPGRSGANGAGAGALQSRHANSTTAPSLAHACYRIPLAAYAKSMAVDRTDDWIEFDEAHGLRHVRCYLRRLTVYTLAAAEIRERGR